MTWSGDAILTGDPYVHGGAGLCLQLRLHEFETCELTEPAPEVVYQVIKSTVR